MRTDENTDPSVGIVKSFVRNGVRDGVKLSVRYGRGRWWDVAIVVTTLILYSIAWPTLQLTHDVPAPLMPIISGLAVFPFLLVRAQPALGWAISAVAAMIVPWAFDRIPGYDYPWQVVHILVLLALLTAVCLREEMRIVLVVWLATVLLFFAYVPGNDGWGWAIGLTAIAAFALLVRWLVLSRRQLAREEEISELERARRAALEEKARIARDLHDIVAHHMSLVVVQAQSAPYRLPDVSDAARAEFESIGVLAREALNEVRGMLGVLRSDGTLPENAPQPGMGRLDELFDASRRAGVDLTARIDGDPASVSDGAGLAVYRIVQESLANAVRHAPGSEVSVQVVCGPDRVDVTVCNGAAKDDGGDRPAMQPELAGGNGIRGMVDRAASVGGRLYAHPRPEGGFEVSASLPRVPAA